MNVWTSVDFCGVVDCKGCNVCDKATNEVVLTEEEFYSLLSLISWAPYGRHSSTVAEMARVDSVLKGDEEDEDG
jgi:hypothetical protein